jgi:hypothetical protein
MLRKHFWLSYSVLLLVLAYGDLCRKLLTDTGGIASRYLPALAITLVVAGITGYCRNKGLFSQHLWRTLFKLLMLASCIVMFMMGWWFLSGEQPFSKLLALTVTLLLLSPAEHVLYRYSFESPQLWQKPTGLHI